MASSTASLLDASGAGNLEAVAALLNCGADPGATNATGQSALILAVVGGHAHVVDLLLERGAPPDAPARTHTALRAAALHGRPKLLARLLAAGADASIVSNNDRTPLMGACFPRSGVDAADALACVRALLADAGARRDRVQLYFNMSETAVSGSEETLSETPVCRTGGCERFQPM